MRKGVPVSALLALTMLSGCVALGSQTDRTEQAEESAWDCESRITENLHGCATQTDPMDGARITLLVICAGGDLVSYLRVTNRDQVVWRWPDGESSVIASFDGRPSEVFDRRDVGTLGRGAFQITNGETPDQLERFRASEKAFISTTNRDGKNFEGTLTLRGMEEKLEYLSFMGGCPL